LVFFAALVLIRFDGRTPGIVLAALLLLLILPVQRMRLSADASGVTVVNLLRAHRIEWSEITYLRLGRVALSTCLNVYKRDGTRVPAWVVTGTGAAAYPAPRVESVISDLRQRLMLANGWSQADLDAHAVEDALAAADQGEYRPSSTLVADGRVDAQTMAEMLVRRSKERRLNADGTTPTS
jgi:hypothetical protein